VRPIPAATLTKPVNACRVALVSSAGLVAPGDTAFDDDVRGGDFSHRFVAADVDVQSLDEHHRSDAFDHAGIEADRNMGLPIDRLHELASEGVIGGVAPRHVSLMGSVTAPGRLVKFTLPEVGRSLEADGVDVALLVPV
jgi:D-proline reductase (dithiol) PrdB